MFGLPGETFFFLTVIPAGWLVYTLGFLYVSRDWAKGDEEVRS